MYIINSTRTNDETLTVNVTFKFQDDFQITLDVPIFMPQSKDDVLQALQNREASEQVKHNTIPVNESISSELSQLVGIPQGE